jgi:hypothetical protein
MSSGEDALEDKADRQLLMMQALRKTGNAFIGVPKVGTVARSSVKAG